MGEVVRAPTPGWGPAELAAIERCLEFPALAFGRKPLPKTSSLSRLIESEIIPRLMLVHSDDGKARKSAFAKPTAEDIAAIALHSISSSQNAVLGHVDEMVERGCSLDDLVFEALAPAARLLGDMWREDHCTFADVTVGLLRLQYVLRAVSGTAEPITSGAAASILLAAAPGEQHRFGLAVLEVQFRRAGWTVRTSSCEAESLDLVSRERFDVAGVSLSCDVLFAGVGPFIAALRGSAQTHTLPVMVGGRFFAEHHEAGAACGADLVVSSPQDAISRALSLCHLPVAVAAE